MATNKIPVARTLLWLGVLLLALGSSVVAGADPGVSKLREAGKAAYDAGNFVEAKKAFDEAFRLAALHSLGVWSARARVKLGEWVQADERYEKLLKLPLSEGDAAAEGEARQQAAREREELRQRIPRVRIRLEGVQASDVDVSIDGQAVAEGFLLVKKQGPFPNGKSLEVNPGTHRIVGVSGDQRKEVSVTLAEGETRDVSLRFVNPDTVRQRKCRDKCRSDCDDNNKCYVDCKHRCFDKGS
jgi:tetratricopeptide (TPR) repeat protein